jgi:lipoyl(octanoyl) transferase
MKDDRQECVVMRLPVTPYEEAWNLQEKLAKQRLNGEIPDTLLLLEHPPTLTLGRGADKSHITASPQRLLDLGVTVFETNRGGDVTYHGPGQLVGYPILKLDSPPFRQDLHWYLRSLEEMLIHALAGMDIEAGRFPGYTGVWTQPGTPDTRKIAAIGIRTSRWVTQHGFALNVTSNLSHFDLIVPCGIHDYGVTSLKETLERQASSYTYDMTAVQDRIIESFQTIFNVRCVPEDVNEKDA